MANLKADWGACRGSGGDSLGIPHTGYSGRKRPPPGFLKGEKRVYSAGIFGPEVTVKIIGVRFLEVGSRWQYQLEDMEGTPLKSNKAQTEPDWIDEEELS